MGRQVQPIVERFLPNVAMNLNTGCWDWKGGTTLGYATMSINGKNVRVHRYLYELHNGAVPADWDVHHVCENRACVNPEHLQAMSKSDHTRIHHPVEPLLERIPKHVTQEGDCLIWTGGVTEGKYPIMTIGNSHVPSQTSVTVAKVQFEAAYGPVPKGHHITSTCDNPLCVNPKHMALKWGTASGIKNLVGQRFGSLVVLARVPNPPRTPQGHHAKWICQCDCGAQKAINGNSLKRGITKSCGCRSWKKEKGDVEKPASKKKQVLS